jgi:hypothetical protein
MKSITVYLRAPLFVPDNGGAAPKHCMVLEGELLDEGPSGGLLVRVVRWADQRGRQLEHAPTTLLLPMAKIDHATLAD